jgi:hypothetical protein
MDWFYLYIVACLMVIAAVGLGLSLIGVPPRWIVGVVVVLLGVGVLSLVKHPRRGDG